MKYTLKQIKESYNQASDTNPAIFKYIFRPISFYVTFVSFRIGINTPNKATVLTFITGIMSLIFMALPYGKFFTLGVIFYIISYIFDHVDGNIARSADLATYYGKFLDGTVNTIIVVLVPFVLAVRLFLLQGDLTILFLGVSVSMILLFSAYLLNRASFFYNWAKSEEGSHQALEEADSTNPIKSRKFPLRRFANLTTDAGMAILFIAMFIGMSRVLFTVYLAAATLLGLVLIIVTIIDAGEKLNLHRISKTDKRLSRNG